MELAQLIRLHRKKARLSRAELSRLAGVGKTLVYDLEHGHESIRLSKLMRILNVLNIQLEYSSPFMSEFEDEKS